MDPKNVPTVKLNNGALIPIVGLGTFRSKADGTLHKAIKTAIDSGYRHFDCALVYENQEEIGKALNDAIKEGKVWTLQLVKLKLMIDPVLGQARGTVHRFQSMDDLLQERQSGQVREEDTGSAQDDIPRPVSHTLADVVRTGR